MGRSGLLLSELSNAQYQSAVKKSELNNIFQSSGLIGRPKDGVRLLANGNISTKIEVHVAGASKSAISAVEKAGGSIVLSKPVSGSE